MEILSRLTSAFQSNGLVFALGAGLLYIGARQRVQSLGRRLRDLEDRLGRTEEQLREASHKTAQVLHDIRSPLSAIRITTRAGLDRPEVEQLLTSSAERIEEIIESLSEAPSAKRGTVHTLTENIALMKRAELQIRPDLHLEMTVAPQTLHQSLDIPWPEAHRVVSNVINNAADAMGGTGQIRCRVEERSGAVAIVIEDSGPGFAPEILQKIGDRPVSSKPQRNGHGGWGLFHATRTLRRYGGDICFRNQGGAQVEVLLPVR